MLYMFVCLVPEWYLVAIASSSTAIPGPARSHEAGVSPVSDGGAA